MTFADQFETMQRKISDLQADLDEMRGRVAPGSGPVSQLPLGEDSRYDSPQSNPNVAAQDAARNAENKQASSKDDV